MRDSQWRTWKGMGFFQRALLVVISPLAVVVLVWWLDRFGEWLNVELWNG